MGTRRAQGIDISRHQGFFKPSPEKKKEIDFVILKASQKTWSDDKFEDFYSITGDFPIRGAYHFFTTLNKESSKLLRKRDVKKEIRDQYPDVKVTQNGKEIEVNQKLIKKIYPKGAGWEEQANYFYNSVKDKGFQFFALDVESGPNPQKKIGAERNYYTVQDVKNIELWIKDIKNRTGKPVLLYTRAILFRNTLLPKGGKYLKNLDLWLAWYGSEIDYETDNPYKKYSIPGVTRWHFWQYSADDNFKGSDYGVDSDDIDLDVFNGTLDNMKSWLAGETFQPGITEEEEITETPEVTVPVETQMDWIITQLEKLIAAGIKPLVEINIDGTLFDVDKLKSLKDTLEQAGITPEMNLSIDISTKGNSQPRTTTPAETTQIIPKTPPDLEVPPPATQESFPVRASAMNKAKKFIVLYTIQGPPDNKGKPNMVKFQPVIRINNGETFNVSSTHKIGSLDKGDGKVIGPEGVPYYFITEYSANEKAIGKYVMKDDVKR